MANFQRERWRKLYLRESQQWRLCSIMVRGLRDYLIRVAEDDGRLVRVLEDAEAPGMLATALQAHPAERGLVELAVVALVEEGFLGFDDGWLVVVNLPSAQGDEPSAQGDAQEPPGVQSTVPNESAEDRRARKARERKARQRDRERDTSRFDGPSLRDIGANTPRDIERDTERDGHAPLPVPPSHSPSAPPLPASQKSQNQTAAVAAAEGARDSESVTERDSSSVTGRDTQHRDTSQATSVTRPRMSFAGAMSLEVNERARWCLELGIPSGGYLEPDRWPEVKRLFATFQEFSGQSGRRLGGYARDGGLQAIVGLLADGYPLEELEQRIRAVCSSPWFRAGGARRGLQSLTPEVIGRAFEHEPIEQGKRAAPGQSRADFQLQRQLDRIAELEREEASNASS